MNRAGLLIEQDQIEVYRANNHDDQNIRDSGSVSRAGGCLAAFFGDLVYQRPVYVEAVNCVSRP